MEEIRIEMLEHAAIIRGCVINAMTTTERIMDFYLAKHFCKDEDKSTELLNCVFATKYITFENKRLIFDYVTTTHKKEIKEKHLKGIHAHLERFNKERNNLAHHVMDFTKSSREHFISTQEVTFLKFEKSREKVRYTKESAELIAKDIFKLGRNLKALFE